MQKIRRFMSRFRFPRKKKSFRGRNGAKLFIVLGIIAVLAYIFYARINPLVREMASASAKNAVTVAINNAIAGRIVSGELDYTKLITLEKDDNGAVTALITDMARINTLKAQISDDIVKSVTEGRMAAVGIPMGNLIGGVLLSGAGPEIPVRIIAVSSVSADFTNEFSSAGINQTRHQIMIEVDVKVTAIIPGGLVETDVSTQLAVAETIIVGNVPDSYLYFGSNNPQDDLLKNFYNS